MSASRTTVLVAAGLTTLAAAYFWLEALSSRSGLQRMTKGVAEAVAAANARDLRRRVIRGEAVPGSAWTEYRQGLALVHGVEVSDVVQWLEGTTTADRAKAVAVVAANQRALDFLRAGARKAEGAYPHQWEQGENVDIPPLRAVRTLTTLAVGQARVLAEAGKPSAAADLLLDAAQLASDAGRSTVAIGELTALSALTGIFNGLKQLPPDPEVGRALLVLEETFPNHGETLQNHLVITGVSLVEIGRGADPPIEWGFHLSRWRFALSRGSMLFEAWTTLERMTRRMAATTTASWAEAQRVYADIQAEAAALGNPLVGPELQTRMVHQMSREGLARLRMLRVLHGGATGLADPFGTTLQSDGTKVWSVGPDGIDQGGAVMSNTLKGDITVELPVK